MLTFADRPSAPGHSAGAPFIAREISVHKFMQAVFASDLTGAPSKRYEADGSNHHVTSSELREMVCTNKAVNTGTYESINKVSSAFVLWVYGFDGSSLALCLGTMHRHHSALRQDPRQQGGCAQEV